MDMPQNQDFKYVLQDFGNIYIGARYSYEEMLKSEEIPYKWKAIIRHYLLKETSPETAHRAGDDHGESYLFYERG